MEETGGDATAIGTAGDASLPHLQDGWSEVETAVRIARICC